MHCLLVLLCCEHFPTACDGSDGIKQRCLAVQNMLMQRANCMNCSIFCFLPNCSLRIHPPAPVSPELAAWHGAHCLFALCSQLGVFSKTNEQPLQNMPGDQVMEEFHHNVSKPWIERLARVDADTQKALDLDAQVRFA